MRRRLLVALGVVAGTLTPLVGAAPGAPRAVCTRWAALDGSAPYRSAQALVDALRPGETGCLKAGVYDEDVTARRGGVRGRPITLRAAPGVHATLRGTLYVARSASDVVVSNLRLDGSTTGGEPSPQVNGTRVTFRADDVTNGHTGICFALGGGFERYGMAVDTIIDHSRIHDCGRLPRTNHDHGIYVEGSVGARITNDVIVDNADWGVHLYPEADGTVVAHNVIADNGGGVIIASEHAGGEYWQAHASDRNLVELNVIASSAGHDVEVSWDGAVGAGNVVRRNCLGPSAGGEYGDTTGLAIRSNVTADPRFVAAARGDFRLRLGSRCRLLGAGVR